MHSIVRNYGLPLGIIAAFVCVDIGLANTSNVTVTGWLAPNLVAAFFLGATLCYVAVRPPSAISELLVFICAWIIFSAAGCILTYLAISHAGPMADGVLRRLDHAIGFDWFAWTAWLRAHPVLETILNFAYASLAWQIVTSIAIFPLRSGRRNEEFLLCAAIAIGLTAAAAAALPAAGPWLPDAAPRPDFALMTRHVTILHAAAASSFSLRELIGIIWFPSFHATLAILFIYCHRGLIWVALPFTVLNVVMLFSIPSEGGHYLTDVFGGIAIAVVSIVVARRLLVRWRRNIAHWSAASPLAPAIPPVLNGAEHP